MSKYSSEVDGLIELGITKTIHEIGARIGNYGAYTFNSKDIKGWLDSLSYYSAIANFLDEYVEGTEDIDFNKLSLMMKLSMSNVRAGSSSVVSTEYTRPIPLLGNDGVSIYVNNVLLTGAPFSVNSGDLCDILATYNGPETVAMMRLEIDSLAVAEEARSVFLNNYQINYLGVQTKYLSVFVYFDGNPIPTETTAIITIIT